MSNTDSLRYGLLALLDRVASLGSPLRWGIVLTGRPGPTPGTGTIHAITPSEGVALTPALVRATEHRLLMLGGYSRTTLAVPERCLDRPDHAVLPAIDARLCVPSAVAGLTSRFIQVRFDPAHLRVAPVPLLAVQRIEGWPR